MQNEDLMVLTEVKPNKKDYTSATIASNAVEKTNSMTGTKDGSKCLIFSLIKNKCFIFINKYIRLACVFSLQSLLAS